MGQDDEWSWLPQRHALVRSLHRCRRSLIRDRHRDFALRIVLFLLTFIILPILLFLLLLTVIIIAILLFLILLLHRIILLFFVVFVLILIPFFPFVSFLSALHFCFLHYYVLHQHLSFSSASLNIHLSTIICSFFFSKSLSKLCLALLFSFLCTSSSLLISSSSFFPLRHSFAELHFISLASTPPSSSTSYSSS